MPDENDRNPIFIPEAKRAAPCCPKCKGLNFTGRRVQGVVTFSCTAPGCGNKWQGGLPQEPMDPRVPYPADPNPPLVDFVQSQKDKKVFEERRAPDLRQDFRKGAPIDEDER